MLSIFSCVRKNSSTPLLRTMRSFSETMTSMSKLPPVCTSDLAKTPSASSAVRPRAASTTCSRSCPVGILAPVLRETRSKMPSISESSGSGYSTTATSLSSSGGMARSGEMRKTVFSSSFSLRPMSRKRRTTSGFFR